MGQHERPVFPVTIRRYRDGEAPALHRIFYKAVRHGTAAFYSDAQRRAWAPSSRMPERWNARLVEQFTLVATVEGRIVGFMSLADHGYLDLAFVLPDHKSSGVGSRLYTEIESEARHQKLHFLTTEASHAARPFFLRHGWQDVEKQTVERHGVALENFRMEKALR